MRETKSLAEYHRTCSDSEKGVRRERPNHRSECSGLPISAPWPGLLPSACRVRSVTGATRRPAIARAENSFASPRATPVGANEQIVEHGRDGLLASTSAEWADALRALRDRSLRARMGAAGRAKVEREYSVQVTAPRLASLLRAATQPCTTR